VLVDLALRELCERFVGLLFLAECHIQQLHRLVQSELRGPGLECPVAGDLVMLDRLRGGEEASVESRPLDRRTDEKNATERHLTRFIVRRA